MDESTLLYSTHHAAMYERDRDDQNWVIVRTPVWKAPLVGNSDHPDFRAAVQDCNRVAAADPVVLQYLGSDSIRSNSRSVPGKAAGPRVIGTDGPPNLGRTGLIRQMVRREVDALWCHRTVDARNLSRFLESTLCVFFCPCVTAEELCSSVATTKPTVRRRRIRERISEINFQSSLRLSPLPRRSPRLHLLLLPLPLLLPLLHYAK